MSLRRCEWRVCGHGQTTSKPSIHSGPSSGLWHCSGNLEKIADGWNSSGCKINARKMKGLIVSSHHMRPFARDFEGSRRVPYVPHGVPLWREPLGTFKIPPTQMLSYNYSSLNLFHFKVWRWCLVPLALPLGRRGTSPIGIISFTSLFNEGLSLKSFI